MDLLDQVPTSFVARRTAVTLLMWGYCENMNFAMTHKPDGAPARMARHRAETLCRFAETVKRRNLSQKERNLARKLLSKTPRFSTQLNVKQLSLF
jgi:hypothetical protein